MHVKRKMKTSLGALLSNNMFILLLGPQVYNHNIVWIIIGVDRNAPHPGGSFIIVSDNI